MTDTPQRQTMKPLFDFSGRDIWVIGGAGYLGAEVVKGLVAHGASVLCADLPGRAAERIAQEKLPMEQVRPADIDAADCEALPAWIANEIGKQGAPHGLVIMTFRSFGKKVVDLLPAEFDEASHVGLTATFLLAREVGEVMANEGRGSIVLFSSMYGTVSPDPAIYHEPLAPNPIEYGVGKAGIQQMARYLAIHWGPRNIRVNSISPGPFPSPEMQNNYPDFIQRLETKSPMHRIGRAWEMAGPTLFLLADASSYVTGHNLAVDGGWTAW